MRKVLLVPAFMLLLGIAIVIVASFVRSTSAAQNANSSTTQNTNSSKATNRNENRSIAPGGAAQQDFSKNTWELPEDADKTKNPVEATAESIEKGKALYLDRNKGNCIFCHGETGAGNEANLARLRRKPADLTNKERMTAMTDGEVFWKITKGINGIMPAGERKMPEAEERWHVVNYVRTLAKDK
ncbi:MAG TPA: cytochrome c [Pyrinomonadaceae bacterium]|jgi:mono/diheme cytochrome c family protein|nr:cytochrome c [Pyrinomonadaceae bacterium]